jgi:hypothetical protein
MTARESLKKAGTSLAENLSYSAKGLYDIGMGGVKTSIDKTRKYMLPVLTTAGGAEMGNLIGWFGAEEYNNLASQAHMLYNQINLGELDPQLASYAVAAIAGLFAFGYGYKKMKALETSVPTLVEPSKQ